MKTKEKIKPKEDKQRPKQKKQALAVISHLSVSAGFPSPAGDYLESPLDLNELLLPRPTSTFFVRARGESMIGAGIQDGDLLVVDRSLESNSNDIVVAILNGEFTVKRFVKRQGKLLLLPANKSYKPIEIDSDNNFEIWGVVTYVIHKAR